MKHRRVKLALLPALLLMLIAAAGPIGCAQDEPNGASGAITITDSLGKTLEFESPVDTIISLAPSNTEIVFAVGAGDKLIGRTDYCNFPSEAESVESVGGFSTPDKERIVILDPDVVLSTGMHYDQGDTDWLEQKGVKVVTLDPQTLDEVLECVSLLGKITGREAESGNLVQDMESRIDYVADMTSGLEDSQKPSVLHVTWHDPLWTVGQGSYIDALIELAGGVNVFSDEEGDIMVDLEAALVADPEVITVFTGHGDAAGTSYEYVISGDSPFKNTQAYINDRIHLVDADIGSRGGPRLVDALEWYAWFIHPELFSEP